MVEYPQQALDSTFGALADSTRREILHALRAGPASVSALAEPFDMSLWAVSKHITVLDGAGLIAREKRGRTQWCRLSAAPMRPAVEWIGGYREFWVEQLGWLDDYLRGGDK